jgi:hypothetical protein
MSARNRNGSDRRSGFGRLLHRAARGARQLGLYFCLLAGCGLALGLAGEAARRLGFTGSPAQLARFALLGLYVVVALGWLSIRKD